MQHIFNIFRKGQSSRLIHLFGWGIIILILIRLFLSLGYSGYNYIFDNDEIHHTQVTYLLHLGYKPFTEIYLTVYPPFFHWFISPLFSLFGFSFDTMYTVRILMIGLFALRTLCLGLIAHALFGKRVAILSIILFLCSPFVAFAEMQIRPDNLMITIFMLGITCSVYAWKYKKLLLDFLASFFIMFSLLLLMKILPSVAVFFLLTFGFMLLKRMWTRSAAILSGLLTAVLIFSLPFIFNGTFSEMTQQVFVESLSSYSGVFEYPVPLGFFYHPRNPGLFGLGGKPFNWIATWIVLLLSGAGAFHLLEKGFSPIKTDEWKKPLFLIFIGGFMGQFAFLFVAESVFIQHYITLNWYMALFAGLILYKIYLIVHKQKVWRYLYSLFLTSSLLFLIHTSVIANEQRKTLTSTDIIERYKKVWSMIPANQNVFPNFLFRPLAYPVPHGHFIGNMPQTILARLPSIPASLEKNNTQYVYIDQYYFDRLPKDAQNYLRAHFVLSSSDQHLYVRKQ